MAQIDEIKDLRDKVASLEADLKQERGKKSSGSDVRRSAVDATEAVVDEIGKFGRGLAYAQLEHLSVITEMTKTFADKAAERNTGDQRDTLASQLSYLPLDLAEAALDTIDKSTSEVERVVNKFNEKYKED